jgi:hypothetical protein
MFGRETYNAIGEVGNEVKILLPKPSFEPREVCDTFLVRDRVGIAHMEMPTFDCVGKRRKPFVGRDPKHRYSQGCWQRQIGAA